MKVSRWKMAAVPAALLVVASPMLTNCGLVEGVMKDPSSLADAASGCPEFESGDFANLKVDAKMKGLLSAASKFDKLVTEVEVGLIESCGELGKALKMPEAELKAEPKDGEGAKKVCGAVAVKLDAFMKANASAQISVTLTGPKCYADIDAMTACFAECGSPVSPGEFKASCQGGELSGECSGKCEGSCQVDAGAECKGTCGGSCSGKCDVKFSGKCGGKCNGKCDGKESKGAACAGTCDGGCDAKAEGSCGGSCEGKCDVKCEMKASGSCKGKCSGGCDVALKAPSCTGDFKPPKVSIECQSQCAAKASASLKCDPPGLTVMVNGKSSAEVTEVVAGLKKALPKIAEIGMAKGKAVVKAGIQLGETVKGSVDAIAKAGVKAATCAAFAAEALVGASLGIGVSVDVSVKVSGSASGSAGGGGKAGG